MLRGASQKIIIDREPVAEGLPLFYAAFIEGPFWGACARQLDPERPQEPALSSPKWARLQCTKNNLTEHFINPQ